ncbi:MAG: helix-turn-helix domain-containing protein [Christensenellaceae bacterium]
MEIGATIRRLRREQGMTQEALAEALNLSPQAVSRWELNLALPDITLLPALASLFDVTADELLGIRTPRQQQRLHDTFVQAQRLRDKGQPGASAALLRAALARYPKHYGLMSDLAISLACDDASGPAGRQEAVALCERVIAECRSDKLKGTTRAILCLLYQEAGQPDRALALARTLPHLWESREMLLADLAPSDARDLALRRAVLSCLSLACRKIRRAAAKGEDAKALIASGPSPCGSSDDPRELLDCLAAFLAQQPPDFSPSSQGQIGMLQ